MSTQTKPKTPATTTVVATNTSPEKATSQLKDHFSNLFGFFTGVSTNATNSSSSLTKSVTEKGLTGFLEAFNKKVKEARPDKSENVTKPAENEKAAKEKGDKSHRENKNVEVKPTEKEKTVKDKGDNSHREKTPQQAVKEEQAHLQPPVESKKPKSAKAKPVEAPAARYTSFKDLFGSISDFVSQTATSIQTSSANVYNKVEAGIDINARVKRGFRPSLIKGEAKKIAVDQATKKRLEEAKKMKENFEKQLKSLDKEIQVLEKGDEDSNGEDNSSRSRQNDKQPKKFRISSQRENSDKSTGSANPPGKPLKKVLGPVEDGKNAGKKWHEGGKALKAVSSQPLYMRMEKEFMQNVIFPELEARKEKLKLNRQFYKPMDDKELREHALKYEEAKKTMHPEKENPEKAAPLPFVKSNAYKRVLEQEKEDKVKTDQKVEERKQLKDKSQQYAKLVKEMFFPKPEPKDDLLSKENLQEIIARSKKAELLPLMTNTTKESNNTTYSTGPKLQPRKKRISQDINENVLTQPQQSPERTYVTHNYLKRKGGPKVNISPPVAEHVFKENKDDMVLPKEGFGEEEHSEVKPLPAKKKYEAKPRIVSMSPRRNEKKMVEKGEDEIKNEVVEPEMAKKNYPNYLVEVRNKRIEQEKKTGKGKYGHWEKVLKNKEMSQQDKMINIMEDINRLEMQAKKKESKLKRHDPNKEYQPLELEDEVGEMYLESIKAKLAIIKDLT